MLVIIKYVVINAINGVHAKQICPGLASKLATQMINFKGYSSLIRYLCSSCKSDHSLLQEDDMSLSIKKLLIAIQEMSEVCDFVRSVAAPGPFPSLDSDNIRALIREEAIEVRGRDKHRNSIITRGLVFTGDRDYQNQFDQMSTILINKSVQLSNITVLNPNLIGATIMNKDNRIALLAFSGLRNSKSYSSFFCLERSNLKTTGSNEKL